MKPASTLRPAAVIFAALLALFLAYGNLTSSDFPRGMYGCPYSNNNGYWQSFDSLNVNLVYAGRSWKGGGGEYHYLDSAALDSFLADLGRYGMGVVLEKGDWKAGTDEPLPYWVQYYAYGQYNKLEVEWDSTTAADSLYDNKGDSYYYFLHDPGAHVSYDLPSGGASLYCRKDSCQGTLGDLVIARGIYETILDDPLWEPHLDFGKGGSGYNPNGMFGYYATGRTLVNRFRMAINNSTGLSSDVTIGKVLRVIHYSDSVHTDTIRHCNYYLKKGDFGADLQFKEFSDTLIVPPGYSMIYYYFYTWNTCDVYIDRIEYMDQEQAYPLFWSDSTRQIALDSIEAECERVMGIANSGGARSGM
ncbi:MAG: hypothetical protein C4524_13845 [Candidatus Zixiibacteriota bacterium]|nr:MAG: hypothetical protein C4524_13845 [candidate division Zixibacteria bacterium]